jgi:SAM-dependent methyltransferase
MLAQLEKRRSALGLSNVFAQQGDGQNLPFVDASFDAAFSMFGLMFFPDRGRGFRELHRVLRPGCPAVVSSWASVDQSPLMTIMMGALRAADPNRAAPQVNLLSLENPEFFHKEMTDAGFCDVEIRPFTHFMEVEGAEQYWNGMVRSNAPLVLLKQRLSAEEWERQSALSRAFVAEHVRGPCKLATTALLGLGRKPHV